LSKPFAKAADHKQKATVRNVNLSVFTQWGIPPFDPNKRKKQKPEHNGEFNEQHGELDEHNGDLDDQHGKHPQTLNELLIKKLKARALLQTQMKTKQNKPSRLTLTAL
jgi:hypothetical protein